LGGCKGSIGPASIDPKTNKPYGSSFPEITIGDMVRAQYKLIESLGVRSLACVTGASMGGQQTLEWILSYPNFVKGAIPIACTARLSAQGLAMGEISRQAILNDPNFNGGDYYDKQIPAKGLAIARMAAHLTYISSPYLDAHYGRQRSGANLFAVQKMLQEEGAGFIKRFDANSFLTLSNAIEKFDIADETGSLTGVFGSVACKILLIAFSTDFLFPPNEMQEIYDALISENIDAAFETIDTIDGHDAFLTDWKKLSEIVSRFLHEIPLRQ
jgi:homoserine O-acetyltransferase